MNNENKITFQNRNLMEINLYSSDIENSEELINWLENHATALHREFNEFFLWIPPYNQHKTLIKITYGEEIPDLIKKLILSAYRSKKNVKDQGYLFNSIYLKKEYKKCLKLEVVEINRIPNKIIIKPMKITFFDNTEVSGFVAYNEKDKVFHYPIIISNYNKNPIQYLYECILSAKSDFKEMMRLAIKKTINYDWEKEIFWSEYEHMFSKQSFYTGKPKESIIVT